MSEKILSSLELLLQSPMLASKKWICQQYDSHVMNDTIQTGGDAAIVRVHGTKKALAISTDCTPRYVEADPFEGAKQAVAETYRNISAVGGKPLAITNCLNFGNPQKPEIMGQIVRSIQGITEACKVLDYPVVSGNVSLYNETDGSAIQPTPAIGGVGLLLDLDKRCDVKFKNIGDLLSVVCNVGGHLNCSLFEKEIMKVEVQKNPPKVDLIEERRNSEFIRDLIQRGFVNACHDISDGGLMVALFEMSSVKIGCDLEADFFADEGRSFGEDQSCYVVALAPEFLDDFLKLAEKGEICVKKIGKVAKDKISISAAERSVEDLIRLNQALFEKKFSN